MTKSLDGCFDDVGEFFFAAANWDCVAASGNSNATTRANNSADADAVAARKQLQAVLDELNPKGGKTVPADGGGTKKKNKKKAAT